MKQSGIVLRYIVHARERGVGVIFISHNPHHAYPVGDHFVILNRGKLQGSWKHGEISRDELVQMMAGGAELDQLTHELAGDGAGPRSDDDSDDVRLLGDAAARRRIGVGLIGFGWLGQAHSRSMQRIKTLFPERDFDPELVICADTAPERLDEAVGSFGYRRGTADWRRSSRTRTWTWSSSRRRTPCTSS